MKLFVKHPKLFLFGIFLVTLSAVWLLTSYYLNMENCLTPKSYNMICDGMIYTEISEDSMKTVLKVYENKSIACKAIKNC